MDPGQHIGMMPHCEYGGTLSSGSRQSDQRRSDAQKEGASISSTSAQTPVEAK